MVRPFRLYTKKRGDRRTGSKTLGSMGEALFFASILVVGTVVLVLLLKRLIIPEWRANHSFEPTTCTVIGAFAQERTGDEGTAFVPQVRVQYEVDGVSYESTAYDIATARDVKLIRSSDEQATLAEAQQFQPGQQYTCWYDPVDPETVVLLRGYTWWIWLMLVLPVAFMGIGGGGLVYTVANWEKSTEHRSATALKGPDLGAIEDGGDETTTQFPFIPRASNLINSPGTMLKYRLPIHSSQGWRLFVTAAVCVIWNGIVGLFLYMAIAGHLRGEHDLLLTLFTLPFVVGGVGLIYHLARQITATGIGQTQLEISDHPLLPGGQYELFISQAGRLSVRFLEVLLVCEEDASYKEGTDIRTEVRRIYEAQVYYRKRFEVQPSGPFQDRCGLKIPDDAMHSFQSPSNELRWKLIVRARVEHWPPLERVFPVIVYPADVAIGNS